MRRSLAAGKAPGLTVAVVTLDRQPLLASDLVVLRPLRVGDFGDVCRIASDRRLWEQHPAKDRHEERVIRMWFDEALASGGALVAQDAGSLDVIGASRYVCRSEHLVEIGWTFLAHSRWGGLWNGEIKRLMLAHAFASVPEVLFAVHADNVRSQRAVERLGAVRSGTEPDAYGRGQNLLYRLRRPAE